MPDRLTEQLGYTPRRIAVFRALQLGDLLVAIPAFRALRQGFPAAQFTLIGLPWARCFVQRYPHYFDDFWEFPGYPSLPERVPDLDSFPGFLQQARRCGFDVAIQLHGSGRHTNPIVSLLGAKKTSGFYQPGESCPDVGLFEPYPCSGHEIQRNLQHVNFLGIPSRGTYIDFPLYPTDWAEFASISSSERIGDNFVCVHPGGRSLTRRWPADRFAAVADELVDRGFQVVLTGSPEEADVVGAVAAQMARPAVNLTGKTSLGGLGALLSKARLLISNDTGVSHVASALRTKSVLIVLGSDPSRWAPLDRQTHLPVSVPIDCRPCSYATCPYGFPCATGLTVDHALNAAERQLASDSVRYEGRSTAVLPQLAAR